MAKVAFSKLNIKQVNSEVCYIHWENDIDIEVKQYLPLNDKLALISDAINKTIEQDNDKKGFFNIIKFNMYLGLGVLYYYTNLTFTDKQKEDEAKLYDLVLSSGLLEKVFNLIPRDEINNIFDDGLKCIKNIYKYNNSIYGIMNNMQNDYQGLGEDAEKIRQDLADGNNIELLQEILSKFG